MVALLTVVEQHWTTLCSDGLSVDAVQQMMRGAKQKFVFQKAQYLRTQLTIAPNFFSQLVIQIIGNQIWNFVFDGGGKHDSKIEIPSC